MRNNGQRENSDRLKMVLEDLDFIEMNSHSGAQPHQMRRISVDLHKFFLEQHLQKSWRFLGFNDSPNFQTTPVSSPLNRESLKTGMPVAIDGMAFNAITVFNRLLSFDEMLRITEADTFDDSPIKLKLEQYLDSTIIYVSGFSISRRTILQYEANKRGGKHYDLNRSRKADQKFLDLDKAVEDTGRFGGIDGSDGPISASRDLVSLSVLSIAQETIASEDVRRFRLIGKERLEADEVSWSRYNN